MPHHVMLPPILEKGEMWIQDHIVIRNLEQSASYVNKNGCIGLENLTLSHVKYNANALKHRNYHQCNLWKNTLISH